MEATVTTPTGNTELCEIRDEPDNMFDIKFNPAEAGINIISLKQKGIHIAGRFNARHKRVSLAISLCSSRKCFFYLLKNLALPVDDSISRVNI